VDRKVSLYPNLHKASLPFFLKEGVLCQWNRWYALVDLMSINGRCCHWFPMVDGKYYLHTAIKEVCLQSKPVERQHELAPDF